MELLPAIDLRKGRVVRLRKGDDAQRTTYDVDPLDTLLHYADLGVGRVHVVDLDAAFGELPQRELVEKLAGHSLAPRIELGGGLRDAESIEWAFDAGVERAVITSMIVNDFELFGELAVAWPDRLVAALDVADGALRYSGWTARAERDLDDICLDLAPLPLAAALVTDISRDGTLTGPNVELLCEVAGKACAPGILSGGVRSLDDLRQARQAAGVAEVVVGKALYDGAIDAREAMRVCRGEVE